jgi:hypothetical protein
MPQNLVPFFALQAVALAILCIALWLCSKSAQRTASFYLFFLSLSSEFVGTILRLMSFFCGTQVLLIGAGRQYDDFWTRVDTSGVLLFAFGLFLKPLFFLSIVETITFKRYLYFSFVFVLFALLPAIGFRHFGYSTISSLFAIFLILLTSIFLLVYTHRVPLKKQFLLTVLRMLLYFILALHSIFALYCDLVYIIPMLLVPCLIFLFCIIQMCFWCCSMLCCFCPFCFVLFCAFSNEQKWVTLLDLYFVMRHYMV